MLKNKKKQKGALLIEILIALAISAIMLPALANGVFTSRQGKAQEGQRIEATALLKEAVEAVRSVRERDWGAVSTSGIYHPVVTGTQWDLSSGTEVVDGLTRKIEIQDIFRDSNGNVVSNGGTLDPSSKKVSITVSWTSPYSSSVNSIIYLTRYVNNKVNLQTAFADFTAGNASGTAVVNTSGGEVVLGAGGKGNWCDPNLSIAALDLPKNGVANAISAIEGNVSAGTGENSSGISFANILVSNTNPPTSSISGTFDGYKTNGVFNESNYAYLGTDNNSKEVIILDLNNKNPVTGKFAEAGYFNAPGNGTGKSVYVSGNIGYVAVANKLYTFDLSSKSGSRPQLAVKTLAANGTKIVVVNSYAYVSIAGATEELQVFQINPAGTTITLAGKADVNGQAAYDVAVNTTGTRAYLATGADPSKAEFFIVDTSVKNTSSPKTFPNKGTYDTNGMDPNAVAVVTGNKAIIVGTGGEEYQVIDITNENSPTRCGGLQINTGVNGIASVLEADGDAYSYIITGDLSSELKIIEGGPGGKYSTSGTFTSKPFDATASAAFNRFIPSVNVPNQTTLTFQVAVAAAVNNSCNQASYYYIGPDQTPNTSYTQAGAIPLVTTGTYTNPGRCFSYKAYFNTNDGFVSPTLYDASVNYSP